MCVVIDGLYQIFFRIFFYIILPIRRMFRLYLRGVCIEDNPRNQAALEYFIDVANNPARQPQTPVEHFFENKLAEQWDYYYPDRKGQWEEYRQEVYQDLSLQMIQFAWVTPERDD